MGSINSLKQSIVSQLLEKENFILIVVDARHPDIRLPEHLLTPKQPVPLHIGWKLAIPIPDLVVNETGISGTLSFNRTPQHCVIPWPAVMQVTVENEHLIWICPPEDGVIEVEKPRRNERPKLKLVE